MRRRTVLVAAGSAFLAGCLGSSSGNDSPSAGGNGTTANTPASTGAAGDGFAVSEFDVSTTRVAPTEQYFLRITHVYSTDAVEREEGEQTIRDVSDIDDPALRSSVEAILSEGKLWRAEIPQGLRALTERVDFFTWNADTDPEDTATHWGVDVYRAYPDRAQSSSSTPNSSTTASLSTIPA